VSDLRDQQLNEFKENTNKLMIGIKKTMQDMEGEINGVMETLKNNQSEINNSITQVKMLIERFLNREE
jgi:hypothetical protein